ncbi:LAS1-like family protein [Cryptosporidium andersoni]|uniref:LAS1-like family protein n=1 Tax=Cryptosporidium andersoni TaxID=117008 RepID=A0A1J4MV57_9CRYT|nr:LAS1-like family protein [Cryptosporidium andersoni]
MFPNIVKDYRVVPWYNSQEFFEIYQLLVHPSARSKNIVLNRLTIWQDRNFGTTRQTPIAIACTIYLLHSMIQDNIWDWPLISELLLNDSIDKIKLADLLSTVTFETYTYSNINQNYLDKDTRSLKIVDVLSLQELYSMAIVRIINMYVDQCQLSYYARSVSSIASDLGLPNLLVEIRHQATHGSELPSLESCRTGAILVLSFLFKNYWRKQYNKLFRNQVNSSIELELSKLLHELLNLIRSLPFDHSNPLKLTIEKRKSKIDETGEIPNESFRLVENYDFYCHSVLSKVIQQTVAKRNPTRKVILKYCRNELTKGLNKSRKKELINIICTLTKLKHDTKSIFKVTPNAKTWIRLFFLYLTDLYALIDKIISVMKVNDLAYHLVEKFIIQDILPTICPLCYPVSSISILILLSYTSNNTMLKILSGLLFSMNNTDILTKYSVNSNEQKEEYLVNTSICPYGTSNKINTNRRFFYWLTKLLPFKYSQKAKGEFLDIMLLLSYYKHLQTKKRGIYNINNIIDQINITRKTMVILLKGLFPYIPSMLFQEKEINNLEDSKDCLSSFLNMGMPNYIENDIQISLCHLMNKLGIYPESANLIEYFIQNPNLDGIDDELTSKYCEIVLKSQEKQKFSKVSRNCISSLLDVGTSWDPTNWTISDHLPKANILLADIEGIKCDRYNDNSEQYEDLGNLTEDSESIFSCEDEKLPNNQGTSLGLSSNFDNNSKNVGIIPMYSGSGGNLRANENIPTALIEAESYWRKNFGISEGLFEKGNNINWMDVQILK